MIRSKLALLSVLVPLAAAAAPATYEIDPVHSFTQFEVNHLGFSTLHGRFDRETGKVSLDLAARTGSLDVSIDTASVSTGDAKHEAGSYGLKNYGPRSRDEHLRSADFFNVAEFPSATYKSTRFVFSGDTLQAIEGNLTLVGVTKPLRLTVTSFKCGPHPFSRKELCGADATATFKRSEFGIKAFVGPVSDEVKLTFNVEAYKE